MVVSFAKQPSMSWHASQKSILKLTTNYLRVHTYRAVKSFVFHLNNFKPFSTELWYLASFSLPSHVNPSYMDFSCLGRNCTFKTSLSGKTIILTVLHKKFSKSTPANLSPVHWENLLMQWLLKEVSKMKIYLTYLSLSIAIKGYS